jgi:transcriptional regulator with XRE-family HTH domain
MYVSASRRTPDLTRQLGAGVTVLDARASGRHGDPARLEQELVAAARDSAPLCVVIDGLDAFSERWGDGRAAAFFSRVCPRLFDLDAIAYWRAPRPAVSRKVMERITGVTQCVVELSNGRLRLVKAEGRSAERQGRLVRARIEADELVIEAERALGRLARGLERVRRERQLSQAELARLAGVSASAISQAEGGRRGLSLDTLLLLTGELGITIDDLLAVATPAGYVLARRARDASTPIRSLFDDPKAGIRVYLVRLAGGESGQPPHPHKGTEVVLVIGGLIQLQLGSETPVLRSGDAALATTVALASWRNLTSEPAVLFWIVGDALPNL